MTERSPAGVDLVLHERAGPEDREVAVARVAGQRLGHRRVAGAEADQPGQSQGVQHPRLWGVGLCWRGPRSRGAAAGAETPRQPSTATLTHAGSGLARHAPSG